ncbi:MAG: ATP-binding cassette domain-containing protein [Thermodesulfobacteriota bacterium]
MTARAISCRNLSLQFDKNTEPILQDINLTIPENSIVLLYGATGKGKTSLFNALTGLNFSGVRQGEIYWGKRAIPNTRKANKLRPDFISLIYSHFYFLQSLNVEENVLLPAVFSGKSSKYIRRRLELLSEVFDFEDQLTAQLNFFKKILYSTDNHANNKNGNHRRPNKVTKLSNGQREIVNIARALIVDTPFIFADELLRSYSEAETEVVWNRLLDPRLGIKQNKTLFMITRKEYFRHDPRVDLVYEIDGQAIERRPAPRRQL